MVKRLAQYLLPAVDDLMKENQFHIKCVSDVDEVIIPYNVIMSFTKLLSINSFSSPFTFSSCERTVRNSCRIERTKTFH
jgi:hypothetical protein